MPAKPKEIITASLHPTVPTGKLRHLRRAAKPVDYGVDSVRRQILCKVFGSRVESAEHFAQLPRGFGVERRHRSVFSSTGALRLCARFFFIVVV